MDPTFTSITTTEFDTVATFSSRGPAIRTGGIKPELLAVGTDLYTGTQSYDPNGNLYDPNGYTAVNGTSFASAIVAGVVAMVKQKNPNLAPAYLKSAVINTANNTAISDFDSNGRQIQASVMDQGAGKLDAAAAVQTNITVSPSTVSFGILDTPNLTGKSVGLNFCNSGGTQVGLSIAVQPSSVIPNTATVQVDRTAVTVAANTCTTNTPVTVSLTGTRPRAGVYEGNILIRNGAVPLHIPYLFIVGDGVPFSAFPITGGAFESVAGATHDLLFKVTDQYGVPVSNASVKFFTAVGDGTLTQGSTTDELGIGYATATLGSRVGEQWFGAQVGSNQNFIMYFEGYVRPQMAIDKDGVHDAATNLPAPTAYAPGSYLAIKGQGLSDSSLLFNTPYLPVSVAGVSVSFDVPSSDQSAPRLSYPARVQYVSANQINVQIPWELQGQTSAQMKVSLGDFSTPVVSVPLAAASPSIFENSGIAAAVGDAGIIGGSINARRGSVISLYTNGLGPVDNQPASGDPASTTTLSRVKTNPTVQIGGQPAEVLFAGLAPGYVGLYQINVRVPANAPTGVQPVVVSVGAVNSKSSNIPVE